MCFFFPVAFTVTIKHYIVNCDSLISILSFQEDFGCLGYDGNWVISKISMGY